LPNDHNRPPQQQTYKDKKKADLAEARAALKSKEALLHDLQQKHARVKHTIATQAFSVQEFQGMCKERSRKRNALQAAQKDKDAVQAEIWDIEVRGVDACVRTCVGLAAFSVLYGLAH
jgi:hypothetical protein